MVYTDNVLITFTCNQVCVCLSQMTSVERLMEYAALCPEAPLESEDDLKPPSDWPKYGIVSGEDVKLRYSKEGNYVLKSLRFCIRAEEKVIM